MATRHTMAAMLSGDSEFVAPHERRLDPASIASPRYTKQRKMKVKNGRQRLLSLNHDSPSIVVKGIFFGDAYHMLP